MNDWPYYLVVGVFVCQLISISIWISHSWRKSRETLLNNYPESTFPNLYVQATRVEFQRLKIRKWLDVCAFVVGVVALASSMILAVKIEQLSEVLIYIAIVQLVPFAVSAIWCTQNSHLMKKQFPAKVRKASLRGNTPFDSLPKASVTIALVLFVVTVVLGLNVRDYLGSESAADKLNQLQTLNVAVFIAMLLLGMKTLLGAKTDNFATPEESRTKAMANLRYLANGIITFNVFVIAIMLTKAFDFKLYVIMVLTSLVVQVIVYSTKEQYLPINPSVYK